MFPKTNRTSTILFEKILKTGLTTNSEYVYVKFILGGDKLRVATVVPKKVESKAVGRNKLKRRINSIIRKYENNIKIGTYLFFAKKGAEKLDSPTLETQIKGIISKFSNN